MEEVKCRISTVKKISEDTLRVQIDGASKFQLKDFNELKSAVLKVGNGRAFYNIITIGSYTVADKEAREASCSIEGSYYKLADAFVVESFTQKLMAWLMIIMNKPIVPTKVFNSVAEAEKWIKDLKTTQHKLSENYI